LKKKVEIKNELLYLFLILLVSIYFAYTTHTPNPTYILSGVIGILLILTWSIRAFSLYSGRKISQYSEVIQRISIKERFFTNFVLPVIFYISLLFYIYYNTSFLMDMILIAISLLLLLILFINVKSSFKKVYSIEGQTRAVFDFICIASFYMILSVVIRLAFSIWLTVLLISIISLIFLWSDIKIHRKESLSSLIISLISSLFIAMTSCIFLNTNIFVVPAVGTLAFYLILSLWNIRFLGKLKLVEYLPPFIYSILALILILNI